MFQLIVRGKVYYEGDEATMKDVQTYFHNLGMCGVKVVPKR